MPRRAERTTPADHYHCHCLPPDSALVKAINCTRASLEFSCTPAHDTTFTSHTCQRPVRPLPNSSLQSFPSPTIVAARESTAIASAWADRGWYREGNKIDFLVDAQEAHPICNVLGLLVCISFTITISPSCGPTRHCRMHVCEKEKKTVLFARLLSKSRANVRNHNRKTHPSPRPANPTNYHQGHL
jgi:hypothetical protein